MVEMASSEQKTLAQRVRTAVGDLLHALGGTLKTNRDQGRNLAHEPERRLAERASSGESHRHNYNVDLADGVGDMDYVNYDPDLTNQPGLERRPVEMPRLVHRPRNDDDDDDDPDPTMIGILAHEDVD